MSPRQVLIAAVLALGSMDNDLPPPSNYKTQALSQALQSDALTVISYSMIHKFSADICARLGSPLDAIVAVEVAGWNQRNGKYIQSAAKVLDAFAALQSTASDPQAGKKYSENALAAVYVQVGRSLKRQFNDANPDNKILPAPVSCDVYAGELRSGKYDFRNMPKAIQALTSFKQGR
jgi:hypothetical protein